MVTCYGDQVGLGYALMKAWTSSAEGIQRAPQGYIVARLGCGTLDSFTSTFPNRRAATSALFYLQPDRPFGFQPEWGGEGGSTGSVKVKHAPAPGALSAPITPP